MVTIARPESLAEAQLAVGDSRGPLLFRGAGTKQTWESEPAAPSLVVATTGLDRLVAHHRDDFTVTVEAGLALADLQAALRPAGQWVPVDPPSADAGGTVGGIFATDESGPRRLAHGSLRDLVIGVTVVLGDGTVASSGGRVIKNVAGYDLARLYCGAFGTLGLVTALSLRVAPLPGASQTVRIVTDPSAAGGLALAVLASPVEPSAVDWFDGALLVRLEGRQAGVEQRAAAVAELAGSHATQILDGAPEAVLWDAVGAAHRPTTGTVVRLCALPDRLAAVHDAAGAHGPAAIASHVGTGMHSARFHGPVDLAGLATAMRRIGGHLRVQRLDDGNRAPAPHPPPAVESMRGIKQAFDPDGRCAPGRLAWLTA